MVALVDVVGADPLPPHATRRATYQLAPRHSAPLTVDARSTPSFRSHTIRDPSAPAVTQLPPRREKSASSVAEGKCPATEEIATSEGGAGGDAARDPVTVSFAGGVNEKKSTMPSSRPSTRVFGPCFDHRATRMRSGGEDS
jgi:hypothetical protein